MTILKKQPDVSISIVTWNSAKEIRDCLASLKDLPPNWQVWVVDNNSSDTTVEIIEKEFHFVNLIANKDNVGFAKANNQVINQTNSKYVLLLNPDTEANGESLIKSLEIIEGNPKIGLLGVKLCNEDSSLQTTCFHFPTLWKSFIDSFGLFRFYSKEKLSELFAGDFFGHDQARKVEWVKGAFMLTRREAIEKSGALPEDYFMFTEDMDWCWQIWRSGYEIWFSPVISVKHKSNKSAGQMPSRWRVQKTTLSKYIFCFKNFGWFIGRLIQLTDFMGVNYKIYRNSLTKTHQLEILEWKMARKEIAKSVFLTRHKIETKLKERN